MKKLYKRYGNMKIHSLLLLALFLACTVTIHGFAQMTVVSGGKVVISAGGYLNSTENLVINNGGNVDVQGTLNLKKNLQNGNVIANSLGAGTVLFNGTVAQVMTGLNVINHLTLNNALGLSIANDSRVNGILNLTSGRVSLGGQISSSDQQHQLVALHLQPTWWLPLVPDSFARSFQESARSSFRLEI